MTSYFTTYVNTQLRLSMESVMGLLNFANFKHIMCDNSAGMRSSSGGDFQYTLN